MQYNLKLQQIWLHKQSEFDGDYELFLEEHEDLDLDDLTEILEELECPSDLALDGTATLYHGSQEDFSDEGFDFDCAEHFSIHIGSKEQASQFGDYLYEVKVDLGRAIELDDLGVWGLSSLIRELKGKDVISQEEIEHIYERDQHSDGESALRETLVEKGYGHISYTNKVECEGEKSFILLSPEQVKNFQCVSSPSMKRTHAPRPKF